MKTQKFHSQPVVAALTAVLCVGGALFIPMTASVAAKVSSKTKPSKSAPSATPSGTPSATPPAKPSGTPSATPPAKPSGTPRGGGQTSGATAGANDIVLLQAALSITLTDAQKTSITASATTRDAAVKVAITAYQTKVAAILGMSAADLEAKIKSADSTQTSGDITTLLTTVLGVTLTDAEKTALADAATTRDAALSAAIDAYGVSVAAIVNLSATDLQIKVQVYLDAHTASGKGGSSGGKGGSGDCKPPTTGTTTTTTGTTTTGTTTTGSTTTTTTATGSGGYA